MQTSRLREELAVLERGVTERIQRHLLAVTGEVAGVRRDLGDRLRAHPGSPLGRATALSFDGQLADGLVAAARPSVSRKGLPAREPLSARGTSRDPPTARG